MVVTLFARKWLAISLDDSIKLSGYDKAVCFVAARCLQKRLTAHHRIA